MQEIPLTELASHVGHEIGVSDWLEINQERVNRFADATGDHQWIHVDVERAMRELGGPVAHGFLTLSLIPFLSKNISQVTGVGRALNYGCNKVRFITPVPVGAKVRLRQKLLSCEPKGGGYQIVSECTVEVEGEQRPACVAETIALFYPA